MSPSKRGLRSYAWDPAFSATNIPATVGFADVWNRTLVYFGIAEEDEEWDEDGYATEEELERSYRERPNVRRLSRSLRKMFCGKLSTSDS